MTNCILKDIGWASGFKASIYSAGGGMTISQNTFGKAARFHIRITSRDKHVITDNEFYHALALGEDTGVIHVPGFSSTLADFSGSEIANNIVHDIFPMAAFDTNPGYNSAKVSAFYMEEIGNYSMHHNLVYNMGRNTEQESSRGNFIGKEEGNVFFFPTQARDMTSGLEVKFYNNTAWNCNHIFTAWLQKQNDQYGKMQVTWKNNIWPSESTIESQTLIFVRRTGVTPTDRLNHSTFAGVIQDLNAAPWSSTCSEAENLYLSGDKTTFFKGDANDGNFEPKGAILGGEHLEGFTANDGAIEIGAYEGATDLERTRVARAGSDISVALFPFAEEDEVIEEEEPILAIAPSHLIKVYPNPTDGVLKLVHKHEFIDYEITDLKGNVIIEKLRSGSDTIDLSDLKSGIYLLRVNHEKEEEVYRFVKQ